MALGKTILKAMKQEIVFCLTTHCYSPYYVSWSLNGCLDNVLFSQTFTGQTAGQYLVSKHWLFVIVKPNIIVSNSFQHSAE